MEKKINLILENGRVFEGKAFGRVKDVTGEIVFTTGMTGYIETLTDPSYCGQMIVQTFPLIGNYGIIEEDFESEKSFVKAYIVREYCEHPSNYRCEGTLDEYLKKNDIPGMYDVDTRELTRIIREHGTMKAKITSAEPVLDEKGMSKEEIDVEYFDMVEAVTCDSQFTDNVDGKYNVVLWDFGAKRNIRRELLKRGCNVTTVPASATAEEIKALNPDGIMLSNGPGDPKDNVKIIAELKELCKANIPTFGICLGHQLLALSQGGKTEKLKYGHRGGNQPVKDLTNNRIYVSSQNHGYAVNNDELPENAQLLFINVNDGTCEGIKYTNMPVFSVQFHPEACGGPHDTAYLFDKFINLMEGVEYNA